MGRRSSIISDTSRSRLYAPDVDGISGTDVVVFPPVVGEEGPFSALTMGEQSERHATYVT